MANDTGAFGLRPIRNRDGNPYNGAVEKCYVSSSYATALFVGMPVQIDGETDNIDPTGHHITVEVVDNVAAGVYYGVIVGIEPIQTDLNKTYIPASTGGYVYVATGKNTVFLVRGDGGASAVTDIGLNAPLVATAAGSTATGLCGWHLAQASIAVTQALPLTIIGIHQREDNIAGVNALYEVVLNTGFPALAAGDFLGIAVST